MKINATLIEDETEFFPGSTQYVVEIHIPDKEPQEVILRRDNFHGTFSGGERTNPILKAMAISCIKDHLANIYSQGSY